MTAAAATTASARAGAAGGARGAGDIHALAGRLAKNEKDPDKLTEAMTGLGYSKSEARDAANKAVGGGGSSSSAPRPSSWAKSRSKSDGTKPVGTPFSTPRADPEGEDRPGMEGSELREAKPVGFSDDSPRSAGFRMPSGGGSGAGLLLAVVLYPAGLAFLRGGPAGLKAWLAAKFLNHTTSTGTKA